MSTVTMTITMPNGQKFRGEELAWPSEPPIMDGPCGTCVTPQWCMRENTCAQGKQLRCEKQ